MTDTDTDTDTEADADSTTNVRERWPFTNDLVGAMLLATLPTLIALHGAGYVDVATAPGALLVTYAGVVGADAVWMFGIDAVKTWTEIRA